MAQGTGRYTLIGFGEDLDLRPLFFVEDIQEARICSVCGVVPKKNAFLPCRHVLCEACYEQCVQISDHCVLDGEACPTPELHWREFSLESLMKRR
ncbi:hypothetical protein V5799_026218, partial [Amblyomma americanum]